MRPRSARRRVARKCRSMCSTPDRFMSREDVLAERCGATGMRSRRRGTSGVHGGAERTPKPPPRQPNQLPSNEPTAPIHALEARAERAAGASIDTRAPGDRSVLRRRDAELSGTRPEPPCDPSDAGRRVRAAGVAARQVSTGEPNGAGETERAGRGSLATAPIACIMQIYRRRVVGIARSPTAGTTTFVRLERRAPSRQRASSDRMRKTTSSPPRPWSRPLVADRRDATALRTAGAGRRSGPSVSEGSRPTRLP